MTRRISVRGTASSQARKPKVRLAPSYEPHACVVLAVDTAERSGWALYVRGKLVNWGEVDMLRPQRSSDRHGPSGWDADRVCLHALVECTAVDSPLPVVLVFERPFDGAYQGQWIGAWRQVWKLNGGADKRALGVFPATWRSRVLGLSRATREVARAGERARAQREIANSMSDDTKCCDWTTVKVGGDEAAAICIGLWAVRAGEVAKVLPKPRAPKRKAEVA